MRSPTIFAGLCLLALACVLPGCGGKDKDKDKKPPADKATDKGGEKVDKGVWLFAEPGHAYHIRLTVDKEGQKAVAQLLDEKAKNKVEIAEESIMLALKDAPPVQIPLKSTAEKGAKAWKFEAKHERFGKAVDPGKMEITVTIAGKDLIFQKDDDDH